MTTEVMPYRYVLTRDVAPITGVGTALFVMLNPSTADESQDDPTIRRCKDFAIRLGCARLEVVNLFPYRATKPIDLHKANPLTRKGHDAERYITAAASHARTIVVAWGAHAERYPEQVEHITDMLIGPSNRLLWHLGLTSKGLPRHPLMVRADAQVRQFPPYQEPASDSCERRQ